MKKRTKKQRLQDEQQATATGARRREFPAHLASTPDEWRALKRQEWREVMSAFQRFQYGAAYVPEQAPLYKVWRILQQITEAMEQPDWVAW